MKMSKKTGKSAKNSKISDSGEKRLESARKINFGAGETVVSTSNSSGHSPAGSAPIGVGGSLSPSTSTNNMDTVGPSTSVLKLSHTVPANNSSPHANNSSLTSSDATIQTQSTADMNADESPKVESLETAGDDTADFGSSVGGSTNNFVSPPGYLSDEGEEEDKMDLVTGGFAEPVPGLGPVRSQSAQSNASSNQSSVTGDICRICHCEGTPDVPLITPCYCAGSLKFVHQKCLQQWIKSSQTRSCEVCRYSFLMETKLKPFTKWEKLDISSVERRKILCSVTFHVIAITCVVWSLYVLIDRTAEEIGKGELDWPFWTKLVVVAIGFTGGVVFMYVQCKMYVQLFRRWKAYNKVIFVQDCPEGLTRGEKKSVKGLGRTAHGSPHVIIEIKPHRTVAVTCAPNPL